MRLEDLADIVEAAPAGSKSLKKSFGIWFQPAPGPPSGSPGHVALYAGTPGWPPAAGGTKSHSRIRDCTVTVSDRS